MASVNRRVLAGFSAEPWLLRLLSECPGSHSLGACFLKASSLSLSEFWATV